jgi:hypothetical protein
MKAANVDDVVRILDGIIADCRTRRDPLGYFPALYRQVTVKVREGIAAGRFDDGPRMDRFDTAFANRFLAAYDAFRMNGTPSECWRVAFEGTRSGDLIVLQALLVGMSAHINFDLGLATAEMFEGPALHGFHEDFDRINDVLAEILPRVETAVGRVSPLLNILAKVGGKPAIETLDFSMAAARGDAWLHALLLSALPPAARPPAEQALDTKVAFLGKVIARPLGPIAAAVVVIRETESHDVAAVIDALS